MYQALYRKWRPRRFDDVVGQEHITETLKRQVDTDRLSHAYLFTGTRGTGKTSCAKILSKAVNCEQPQDGNPCNTCTSCVGIDTGRILDVLELDAASNNGVDQVRALREEAVYTPASVRKRVYIIDEVHMLSTAAFNALLKILEEPPAHLMFILATTELHKVPATIKSRCQQYSFKRITSETMITQLHKIASQEGFSMTNEAGVLLSRLAEGGLRDALSLLDQCMGSKNTLDEADILQVLGLAGNIEIVKLFRDITEHNNKNALHKVSDFYRDGKEMSAVLSELSTLIRDVLLFKTSGQANGNLISGGFESSALLEFSSNLHIEELVQMLSIVQATTSELYRSTNRRTDTELCIIRLCERGLATDLKALLTRIAKLEDTVLQITTSPSAQTKKVCIDLQEQSRSQSTVEKIPAKHDSLPPRDDDTFSESVLSPSSHKKKELKKPAPTDDSPPWDETSQHSPLKEITTSTSTFKEVPIASDIDDSNRQTHTALNWSQFAVTLKGKIPPSAYTFISKPNFSTGKFEENTLTIYLDSDMTKALLNKKETLQVLKEEASTYAEQPITIKLQVGIPDTNNSKSVPKSKPNTQPNDKLDDLLKLGMQYDNITIK